MKIPCTANREWLGITVARTAVGGEIKSVIALPSTHGGWTELRMEIERAYHPALEAIRQMAEVDLGREAVAVSPETCESESTRGGGAHAEGTRDIGEVLIEDIDEQPDPVKACSSTAINASGRFCRPNAQQAEPRILIITRSWIGGWIDSRRSVLTMEIARSFKIFIARRNGAELGFDLWTSNIATAIWDTNF